jgi:hypothetical protein
MAIISLLCIATHSEGQEAASALSEEPVYRCSVDLIPGAIRAIGGTGPDRAPQASEIELDLWFELGPYIAQSFQRDILIEADGIDIARAPIVLESAAPGQRVRKRVRVYLPRSLPVGKVTLRGGFLPVEAPGESRKLMASRLAPLWETNVTKARDLILLSESEKRSILGKQRKVDGATLLANGGFERNVEGWDIQSAILTGDDGWKRTLAVTVDSQIALEQERALRIDFGGGQDMSFWHINQDISVANNANYLLSYFVRGENIISKMVPLVSIESIGDEKNRLFKATPQEFRLQGTYNWIYVEIPFSTKAIDRMVRIRIRRSGSGLQAYDPRRNGPIQGSVWFDGFRLVRVTE